MNEASISNNSLIVSQQKHTTLPKSEFKTPDATKVDDGFDSDYRNVERSETKVKMFDECMLE